MGTIGILMGSVMSKVRGKAQPQVVKRLLEEAIKARQC
jgi:Asp-tRNA(Asn)/Glu-tRNA(Gln) amidotransferase B subunit